MTNQYVVVITSTSHIKVEAIEKVVDLAKDWARMSPGIWFLSSELSATDWYTRIRAVLHPTDNIVVHKLDQSDRNGWASKPILEYFNRDKDSRPGM